MAKAKPQPTRTSRKPTATTDSIAALTLARIKGVSDVGVSRILTRARNVAIGIVAAGKDKKLAPMLTAANLTLEDAQGFAADALHLLDEVEDRDDKLAAAHAAVAAVVETHDEIEEHLTSAGLMLRGAYGPKSPSLTKFGFKPLATGGRKAAAKKKKKGATTTPAAKPAS